MLLHDLALAGVGGCTVDELKERLSFIELQDWAEYEKRRGPLNIGQRIDLAAGRMMVLMKALKGQRSQIYDFLPYVEKPEMKIEQAFGILVGSALGHKARKKAGLLPRKDKKGKVKRREKGTLSER